MLRYHLPQIQICFSPQYSIYKWAIPKYGNMRIVELVSLMTVTCTFLRKPYDVNNQNVYVATVTMCVVL